MAIFKANEVVWMKVEVMGKECLFSDLRIDRNSIPEGYFKYEIRHSDDNWDEPVEMALGVLVNFYGTLLTKEQFTLEPSTETNNAYLQIEEYSWWFMDEVVKF